MTLAPKLFDRQKAARSLHRARNAQPAGQIDFITRQVLDDLAFRLGVISHKFSNALLLAPQTDALDPALASATGPIAYEKLSTLPAPDRSVEPHADPENLSLPRTGHDLVISLFDIAMTDDVPGFLTRIRRHMRPDGLFIAAFVGGTSLHELRSAWLAADARHLGGALARIPPFIDTKDAGALLQRAGFALPVTDKQTLNLRYASAMHLMKEIRQLGATAPLATQEKRGLITPAHLRTVSRNYQKDASDGDGRIRATLEIIWMSGWVPHESQPKPAKPGSAQVSLRDVLGRKQQRS